MAPALLQCTVRDFPARLFRNGLRAFALVRVAATGSKVDADHQCRTVWLSAEYARSVAALGHAMPVGRPGAQARSEAVAEPRRGHSDVMSVASSIERPHLPSNQSGGA